MEPRIDIRHLRQQLGLSFDDLARKLGVHRTTVNRWENGKSEPTGPAMKLLRALQDEAAAVASEEEVA